MIEIRAAVETDLGLICAVQVASWQGSYRGLVADSFLENQVPEVLATHWARWPGPEWRIAVAQEDGAVLGFVAVDLEHAGGPYVDNLHVAVTAQGSGLGRRLMGWAATEVLSAGHDSLWLTVIQQNKAALGFYGAIGGAVAAPRAQDMFGQEVLACPVHWTAPGLRELKGSRTG